MSATVRIVPSGKQFTVESRETILEAALRAGLPLDYNCSNGTCGKCKGRLVSGTPAEILHHDYVFTELEKRNGYILLCRARTATDLEIEAAVAGGVDDIPPQRITTTVSKIERLSDDVRALCLRTPRSQTLRFLAGQHAVLKAAEAPAREVPIASCPCNARVLEFHVRRASADPFAEYVFDRLRISDKVEIEAPKGRFTLDEASLRPILFIACETGFAPIHSIIEHAIALELRQPMHLYWVAARPGGHYRDNCCRAWQDALDRFHYTPLVHAAPERAAEEAAARIRLDHPDLADHDAYLAGPAKWVRGLRGRLAAAGLPRERLFADALERV